MRQRTLVRSWPDSAQRQGRRRSHAGGFVTATCTTVAFSTGSMAVSAAEMRDSAAAGVLQEIVVEAQYYQREAGVGVLGERSLLDTPISVSVVTADLLENLQVTSVEQLVRTEASMTAASNTVGWYPNVMIRGFNLNNFSNYRVDGLTIANFGAVSFEGLERVEVMKGLTGLQAGFAAPGGIINYVSKRPHDTWRSSLALDFDDQGDVHGHLDTGGPVSDSFGVRVNVAGERLRSYIDEADGERQFISAAFDWQIGEHTLLVFNASYHDREQTSQPDLALTTGNTLPRGVDATRFLGQDWDNYSFDSTLLDASLSHRFNDHWTAEFKANWMQFNRSQVTAWRLGRLTSDGSFELYEYLSDSVYRPVNALGRIQGQFRTGLLTHDLTVGLSGMDFKADWSSTSVFEFVGISNVLEPVALARTGLRAGPVVPAERHKEQGAFIYDAIGIGDQWQIHLGARHAVYTYDRFSAATGARTRVYDKSTTTPSAALIYRPANWASVYASYVEGLERGGQAPANANNALQTLDPLTSEQYELGAKVQLNRLDLTFALFEITRPLEYLRSDNLYVQEGEQRHRGIELSAAGRLSRQLNAYINAMYLDAELVNTGNAATSGSRAPSAPRFNASAFLDYELNFPEGLAFTVGAYHTGARVVVNSGGATIPSFTHVNVGARYRTEILGRATDFRLTVDNVADEFYYAGLTPTTGAINPGPARVIRASIKTYFQ